MENDSIQFTGDDTIDIHIFEELYDKYYSYLCLLSEYLVKDPFDAEEVVSDVFLKFWRLRMNIKKNTSIKAYLCRAVRNTSLNYIMRKNRINTVSLSANEILSDIIAAKCENTLDEMFNQETLKIINKGIEALPNQCKRIFLLSRKQDMSYNDIAEHLSISVNTVKTQMKIALYKIREYIKIHRED